MTRQMTVPVNDDRSLWVLNMLTQSGWKIISSQKMPMTIKQLLKRRGEVLYTIEKRYKKDEGEFMKVLKMGDSYEF